MNERLKGIKEIWNWDRANPLDEMSIDDLQWLIEQAEEKQKLEQILSTEKMAYHNGNFIIPEKEYEETLLDGIDLEDQNQRYKHALEMVLDGGTLLEAETQTVLQALEDKLHV